MLRHPTGKCDKCGSLPIAFTDQDANVTCKKCEEKFKMCTKCQIDGCLKCGGKLESQMDWAANNNIMF